MESVGVDLLLVEVLEVLLEDVVGGFISLAQVLQDLKKSGGGQSESLYLCVGCTNEIRSSTLKTSYRSP